MLAVTNLKQYRDTDVLWRPQEGPQVRLLSCPISDIFYGGERGGGKTDGALGHFIKHAAIYGKYASGLFVRHTYKELEDVIKRGRQLLANVAYWRSQRSTFEFHNGATLKMR